MESRNKVTMCRLCLCENGCFFKIFEMNDWQGYVAAEVISNLLRCQVSASDGYPDVVCSVCLTKLTDFKQFKEFCIKSKETYERMFISSDYLVKHQPERSKDGFVVTEKDNLHEIDSIAEINDRDIIDGVEVKVEPYEEINDLDVSDRDEFKDEPAEDIIDDVSGSELCEEDPLRETLSNMEFVTVKAEPIYYSDDEDDESKVQHAAVDTVTSSYYLQSIDHKTTQCTSKGAVDADSCTRKISTESSSGIIGRSEGQRTYPEERMAPFIQEDSGSSIEVENEKEMKDKEMGEEEEVGKGTAPEKGVKAECEPLECYHCGKVLLTKSSLIIHMKLHGFSHTYSCDVCGKPFQSKYGLTRHALIHTGTKPYKCAECGKYFSDDSGLKRHMRIHTGSKPYKCVECNKCFRAITSLNVHMRTHTGYKPYKCSECSKSYIQNTHLKIHMRTHTGCKPYKCTICSKCFNNNSNLNQHMRTHTGSKPYKCANCNKCFSHNSNLKVHMRIHTGSKPFECDICSKGFTVGSSLKKHLLVHAKEKS